MTGPVNLMTPQAQFRAAADRIARGWAAAIAALILVMAPLGGWGWLELRRVRGEYAAREAAYDPIRRLAGANRTLSTEAAELVKREASVLELARMTPAVAVVARISEAVAEARGAVYVEKLVLSQDAAASGPQGEPRRRAKIDFVGTLGFESSRLIKLLDGPPFASVKIMSSEIIADETMPRKRHVVQCEY
jgi:hypothetical protein